MNELGMFTEVHSGGEKGRRKEEEKRILLVIQAKCCLLTMSSRQWLQDSVSEQLSS